MLLMLSVTILQAQMTLLEKSYDIDRKARKGYLGGVEVDAEKGTFDMIFVLSSTTARKVKREIFTYDKDLNLINTQKDEQDIQVMKTKYKWFNFKGDTYTSNSLTASATAFGKLVFRKKEISWYYLWLNGSYAKKVKMLEKVVPKSESGQKYLFRGGAYEVEADTSVIVLAGIQEKKNDYIGSMQHYEIISCDNQVNIKTVDKIDFQYPNVPIYSAPLTDDQTDLANDDFPRDLIVVFAPSFAGKKISDPKPTNLTYVRISPQGNIVEKFNFESPTNGWRILGTYEREGSVFLYGSAILKSPESKYINQVYSKNSQLCATTSADASEKEEGSATHGGPGVMGMGMAMAGAFSGSEDLGVTQEAIDEGLDQLKYTNFQIGRITNGKFDFISAPNVEEFVKKQAKPEGQKKFVKFDGKRFVVNGISFTKSGDIYVSGQDFANNKDKVRLYKGVYMFRFNPQGTLMTNYGVFLDQKKTAGFFNKSPLTSDMIQAKSSLVESGDGKSLYWLMHMVKSIHKETSYGWSTTTTRWEPLFNIEYGTINTATGAASDFKLLGEDEKRNFYLFDRTNSAKMGNYQLFFSETEKGDKILISRMDLSK